MRTHVQGGGGGGSSPSSPPFVRHCIIRPGSSLKKKGYDYVNDYNAITTYDLYYDYL